jgi:hypothetical protein
MTEGEVVEQLVAFTDILLNGVALIFSVVSAYVVALNYFIGSSNFLARLASFAFITLVLGMLLVTMMGAGATHVGLIARLEELGRQGELSVAGRALLANATPDARWVFMGEPLSIDEIIRHCVLAGIAMVYAALAYLTFLHPWKRDVIAVSVENSKGVR